MELANLSQKGFNTTLMGVVRGVLDYFKIPVSDAMAFGASGHAFLINIHDVICPSGPYCWNYDGFYRLLGNMGLGMENLGFFMPESSAGQRQSAEQSVRRNLDIGNPCSVLNMENQLIKGYDDSHMMLTVPWPGCSDLTPAKLAFGSWEEFGPNFHCNFFAFRKTGIFQQNRAVAESIEYAIELLKNPDKTSAEPYSGGLKAYDRWIEALAEGHGGEHGNWWNGMVWSECRKMAAAYMDEIGEIYGGDVEADSRVISSGYYAVAQNLERISNRELDNARKTDLLVESKEMEAAQLPRLERLVRRQELLAVSF